MADPNGIVWDDEPAPVAAPADGIQWDDERANFSNVRAGSQSRNPTLDTAEPAPSAGGSYGMYAASNPMQQFADWGSRVANVVPDTLSDIGGAATTFEPYTDVGDKRIVGVQEGALRTGASRLAGMFTDALAQVPGPLMAYDLYQKATGGHTPSETLAAVPAIKPETETFRSPAEEFAGTLGGEGLAAAATWLPAGPEAVAALSGRLGPEVQGAAVADDILSAAKPKPRVRADETGQLREVSPEPIAPPTETPPAVAPEQQATQVAESIGLPGERAPLPELARPYETADQAKLKALNERLQGELDAGKITPEQADAVRNYAEPARRDSLSNFLSPEHAYDSVKRAQAFVEETGQPAQYVSMDLRNLGGLNARLGHTDANTVMRDFSAIVREELPDTHAEIVRKGGDEFAATLYGATPEQAESIAQRIQSRAEEYASSKGLHDTPNPKGGQVGTGIHAGTSEIYPGMEVDDITRTADNRVEARKKEATNGRGTGEAVGPARPEPAGPGEQVSADRTAVPADVRASEADVLQPAPRPGAPAEAPLSDYGAKPGQGPLTSVKNRVVADERSARGMDELNYEGKRTFGDAWETGRARMAKDETAGQSLAHSVLERPRPLTGEETAVLSMDRARLGKQHRETMADIAHAMEIKNIEAETIARGKLRDIEGQLETVDRAAKAAGYEGGFGHAARRMMTKEDYSLAEMLTEAKVRKGMELSPKDRAHIESIAARMEGVEKELAAIRAQASAKMTRKAPKSVQVEYDALKERLKSIPKKEHTLCGVA